MGAITRIAIVLGLLFACCGTASHLFCLIDAKKFDSHIKTALYIYHETTSRRYPSEPLMSATELDELDASWLAWLGAKGLGHCQSFANLMMRIKGGGYGWLNHTYMLKEVLRAEIVDRQDKRTLRCFRGAALFSLIGCVGIVLRRIRRRRRRRQGRCIKCGYDLRGSTGRCSECGFTVQPRRSSHRLDALG